MRLAIGADVIALTILARMASTERPRQLEN
jgi:hypothetical protein